MAGLAIRTQSFIAGFDILLVRLEMITETPVTFAACLFKGAGRFDDSKAVNEELQ